MIGFKTLLLKSIEKTLLLKALRRTNTIKYTLNRFLWIIVEYVEMWRTNRGRNSISIFQRNEQERILNASWSSGKEIGK